jgi:hypothetical protein
MYIEDSFDTGLELIEVGPRDRWQKDPSMVVTAHGLHGSPLQQTLARV